jgi:tetratricopeptide (TPR) repeat protein
MAQIAHDLNVDAVVEGTVLRSGGRVQITAQLIDATKDRHLWARSYEGDLHDVLGLQEEVAADIAKQTSIELTPQERIALKNAQAARPDAHDAYLQGRYFWAKRETADDIQTAVRYSKRQSTTIRTSHSIRRPSRDIRCCARLFFGASDPVVRQSRVCRKAGFGNRRYVGGSACRKDFDWQLSETEFQRALDLNPGYANAHHWHPFNLMFLGQFEEALAEMEHAQKLDPLSIIINANVGFVLYHARQWDRAVEAERKSLELDRNSADTHRYLGLALLQQRKYAEALRNLQRAVDLSSGNAEYAAELSYAYAAAGNRARAQQIIAELEHRSQHEYIFFFSLAVAYTGVGKKASALARLQSAIDDRCDLIPTLQISPFFDSIRSETRFADLLRRMKLAS